MRQALQTLLKAGLVFLLVCATGFPYVVIHTMIPTMPWLDQVANSLSTLSTKGPVATHSATVYFFFLAPFLAGCWSWIVARLTRQKRGAAELALGWLGAWLGWSVSVWMTQGYEPFGYIAGPDASLWIPVLAGLPPMAPTGSYFLALGMSALGAVAFTAWRRGPVMIFMLGVSLTLCGITANGFLIDRRLKIARILASEQPASLDKLAHYATQPGKLQMTAINRLTKELEAHPEQAGALVPLLVQAARSGGYFERYDALNILKGDGLRSDQARQAVRQRAEAAEVSLEAFDDQRLQEDFRRDIVRSLGWFRTLGIVGRLRALLNQARTEEERIAIANALALQGDREGLLISLQAIKRTGSADHKFLEGIAESGNEDLIAFVDKYESDRKIAMHNELLRRGRLESIEPLLRTWMGYRQPEGFAAWRLPSMTGSPAASVPFLIHALGSADRAIRSYALQELKKLNSQLPRKPESSDGWGAEEWRSWWQGHGEELSKESVKLPPSIQLDAETIRQTIAEVEGIGQAAETN